MAEPVNVSSILEGAYVKLVPGLEEQPAEDRRLPAPPVETRGKDDDNG